MLKPGKNKTRGVSSDLWNVFLLVGWKAREVLFELLTAHWLDAAWSCVAELSLVLGRGQGGLRQPMQASHK